MQCQPSLCNSATEWLMWVPLEIEPVRMSFCNTLPEMGSVITGKLYKISLAIGIMNHPALSKISTLFSHSYALIGHQYDASSHSGCCHVQEAFAINRTFV